MLSCLVQEEKDESKFLDLRGSWQYDVALISAPRIHQEQKGHVTVCTLESYLE